MADQQQNNVLSAVFPAPAPFYKYFTPANLARLEEYRRAHETKRASDETSEALTTSDQHVDIADLSPELRFLIPPEPPADGVYRSFGDIYNINDILPSLSDQGIEQLYPSHSSQQPQSPQDSTTHSAWTFDHTFYLRKLAKSLLLNFLELVGTLSIAPDQYGRKIEDLRTLFINSHHLINEYRPHQARESLITMMEEQLESSKKETEGVRKMKEKVEEVLRQLASGELDLADTAAPSDQKEGERSKADLDEQRNIWAALEVEPGP
ncbi:mediator of RNA polymerase II transcription subunit 7 [Xylona heveae TC161]|uniref:Mediator of RNA polymerase II transcription subunit 7 n=1 Tax=Xylona heveae (strain CBS 132557 / TC161) TaxID=1328760 RepID=A0A165FI71_XYLHT|nr:mediator of RNA polymerase II transcription subunit 7 [Xylona heveae TC161]KZF21006.1 mediator of RNA polymerase II transcription subunit 7 [Xylona heveae TC161]